MSKFEQILAFIAVVEENGFAKAARKQGISTAAISRQVSRLEAELKVDLLHRTTRQFSLTEVGAQYYQQCKKAMSLFAEADAMLMGSRLEATGMLSITCNRYFATKYLLPRLPEFMANHPKLQIKFELAERFPDLSQENIDLIFGVSMEGPADLIRKRVAITRYVLCASPAYLKEQGIPETPADLSHHHYIAHSMRKPDNVVTFKGNKEIYVEPMLWLNDSLAMRECAIQGMGIVKLHDYMVSDALLDGRLIEILKEYQEPQQPVYLYYQQRKYLQPKIRRFIDFYVNSPSLPPSSS